MALLAAAILVPSLAAAELVKKGVSYQARPSGTNILFDIKVDEKAGTFASVEFSCTVTTIDGKRVSFTYSVFAVAFQHVTGAGWKTVPPSKFELPAGYKDIKSTNCRLLGLKK